MKKIQSIEESWAEFKKLVYDQGMTPEQEKQVYRAFMAGALCVFQATIQAVQTQSVSDEEFAIANLERLQKDVEIALAAQVMTCKARN